MIRTKHVQNSKVSCNCPYDRRNSIAGSNFHQKKKFDVKKMMTTTTNMGELAQLNEFLLQRKMRCTFHLIESIGPSHCPSFTMRLSIFDQAGVIISQTIGTGGTKKSAKQAAAKHYLQNFFHKSEEDNVDSSSVTSQDFTQPKSIGAIEKNTIGNAVGALDAFCRVHGFDKPMYEFKMASIFQCDCKVNNVMGSGTGTKKKLAKHNAAHLVLQQLQSVNANKLIPENAFVSIKMEKIDYPESAHEVSQVSDEFEIGSSTDDTIEDFIEMLDFNKTQVQQNDFLIMENVDSSEALRKLASIVKRYIEIYAEDLKCSPAEYLAAVNYWRHPCEMTELVGIWRTSTLHCKIRELLATDVKHMGTSIVKANNLLITEANSHVLATYYEFCVWTPICLSGDTENENLDYFMISSMDACGNNTIRKYYPKIGEAIVCHHSTKFRFRGSKQNNRNHFYLITEWKTETYNELDSMDRIISTTVTKWDHEKIQKTLLHGLQSIYNTKFDYDLMQCVIEWKRIYDAAKELSEVDRIFIEHCVDAERVKQLLATFLIAIKANERHNARDCDEDIYQKLSEHLLTPIEQFISKNE